MAFPDFIVIGAAKAGTTSLCADLARHPDIFFCNPKEPEFFCRDERYDLGTAWYEGLFAGAEPEQLIGEGSTMYSNCTRFPETMSRMKATVPDAQLVYMIRNPVERAYSYWLQKMKNQENFGGDMEVPRDFDKAIVSYDPIVTISDYKMQLEHILRYYPRSSIHVVVFEEYTRRREEVIAKLCRYLGVDADKLAAEEAVWKNKSSQHFAKRAESELATKLKKFRLIKEGRKTVPKPLRKSLLRLTAKFMLEKKHQPPPMSERARQELEARCAHVRPWLESFLGYSLDAWGKQE